MARLTAVVTGAKGFIGSHIVSELGRRPDTHVIPIDVDSPVGALDASLSEADAVFHIAGVNRPEDDREFEEGNAGFTEHIVATIERLRRRPLIVFSSSSQAVLDNAYGLSKRRAEEALEKWATTNEAPVAIFRLPNVFGKWSRPDYNSVVATFCYRAARDLPLHVSDPDRVLELVYIDDVVASFVACLDHPPKKCEYRSTVAPRRVSLQELAERILSFSRSRSSLVVPDFSDPLNQRLYSTYLSHLATSDLSYPLERRVDARGALAEVLKHPSFGQIFVSTTKPGVTRGNHYHETKVEKFMVLSGNAVVCLQDVRGGEVIEYRLCGEDFRVIDIPPGYTHNIRNVGEVELVIMSWADELFDPERPDTYPRAVGQEDDDR